MPFFLISCPVLISPNKHKMLLRFKDAANQATALLCAYQLKRCMGCLIKAAKLSHAES